MELVRLKAADYEEAIDFLDLVFSKAHCPHSFAEILPIIYRPTDEHMNCNFAVRENGRIRGIVGLFPAEMKIGDIVLKVGGIGGVSAHPSDKGKGWMKLLMGAAIEEMENTGVDISWLSGLRQRYSYFGYEKTGVMLAYEVSQTNLRHIMADKPASSLRFVPIECSDKQYLEKAKKLHDRQPLYCERSEEDFWLFLTAVTTMPWAALNEAGEMVGYMVVSKDQTCITEIFADTDEILVQMVQSWLLWKKTEEMKVLLAPWQQETAREIGRFAEEYRVTDSGNFRIFNWDKVVGSLMQLKQQMEPLMAGSMKLGIEGYGTLLITVEAGKVSCSKTEMEAQVVLDPKTASRVLFGHIPSWFVTELPAEVKELADCWFPLPLCWLIQNHV